MTACVWVNFAYWTLGTAIGLLILAALGKALS